MEVFRVAIVVLRGSNVLGIMGSVNQRGQKGPIAAIGPFFFMAVAFGSGLLPLIFQALGTLAQQILEGAYLAFDAQ
jgi:hypothetical protein